MLGQVPGQDNHEPVKTVEIGDLSMGTDEKPIDYLDETPIFEGAHRAPKRRLATPWLITDLGLFRVDLTIVGPIAEQPKGHFALRRREAEGILKAIADAIETLEQELR